MPRARLAAGGSGYQPLYSDGHSVGFDPVPCCSPTAGWNGPAFSRVRRANALAETMVVDQITRFNGYNYGLPFY